MRVSRVEILRVFHVCFLRECRLACAIGEAAATVRGETLPFPGFTFPRSLFGRLLVALR
jgi:hypothetical protein